MLRNRVLRLVLPTVSVVLALALGAQPSAASLGSIRVAASWSVQAGGDTPDGLWEPTAFFPSAVTVHVGDTVTWNFAGFHTVTFNPNNDLPPDELPGPGAGEIQLTGAFLPIGGATFDGTAGVSSGAPSGPPDQPPAPYTLTFTHAGTFTYYCVIHPGMSGTVTVVPADATLPEQPQAAAARGQAVLQQVLGEAQQGAAQLGSASVTASSGDSVHTVAAGASFGSDAGANVSALQFFPANVTVRSGDTVVWTNPDPFELHTVTFLSGAAAPEVPEVRPQADGPPLIVLPADVVAPVGGTSYTGEGYLNSGLLGPSGSVALTIDAPPGTYSYICAIHGPSMAGTITVLP